MSLFDESMGTFALEGTDSVDTQVLAVVLFGGALIKIDAGAVITVQLVSGGADTFITSHGVAAIEAAWRWSSNAFVHIQAHLFGAAGFVSVIAGTSEASECVDTGTVCTQSRKNLAVIDIFAVGSESGSVGAELHKVTSSGMGTFFTVFTPAFTAVTTALGFSEQESSGRGDFTVTLMDGGIAETTSGVQT